MKTGPPRIPTTGVGGRGVVVKRERPPAVVGGDQVVLEVAAPVALAPADVDSFGAAV